MTGALALREEVRAGRVRAGEVVARTFDAIRRGDRHLNSFNRLLADQAAADAARVDAAVAAGRDPGPLAGVPFAVKALFDIGGVTTTAGSAIWADHAPAPRDATVVARLRAAGALLVGTSNMDEFAFGFTTENAHFGTTRNPHDPERVAGGSSGGCAAAVAADLVPLSLGSDTNGSVRVPASLCGVFGLKPTYGSVPRTGVAALAWSFDHVGWLARSVGDLAAVADVLWGPDGEDPICTQPAPRAPLADEVDQGVDGLRVAVADGYFATGGFAEVFDAVAVVAKALNVDRRVTIREADRAYAASLLITSAEGANLHQDDIRRDIGRFDPKLRDRWIAASLIPAAWIHDAQRFRRWYRDALAEVTADIDVLIAPATPYPAIEIGQAKIVVDGVEVMAKPTLGRFTAPFSFVGWPALSMPVVAGGLPIGVQLVAKPGREDLLLRVARHLERAGVIGCTVPQAAAADAAR